MRLRYAAVLLLASVCAGQQCPKGTWLNPDDGKCYGLTSSTGEGEAPKPLKCGKGSFSPATVWRTRQNEDASADKFSVGFCWDKHHVDLNTCKVHQQDGYIVLECNTLERKPGAGKE